MIRLLVNGKETLGHQQPYKRGHLEIRELIFIIFWSSCNVYVIQF